MMDKINDTFQTHDFQLATFLYARGVILDSIIDDLDDSKRKVFVFLNVPQDLISEFQSGGANVGVFAFTNAQNALRDKLRELRNG